MLDSHGTAHALGQVGVHQLALGYACDGQALRRRWLSAAAAQQQEMLDGA
jgi:hypothetical protein